MAAPTPSFIRLADDAALTGARMRTQSRVVGSDTVHEAFPSSDRRRDYVGTFSVAFANLQSVATAHSGLTAFLYLINQSTTNGLVLRRIEFAPSVAALANVMTYITLERWTVDMGISTLHTGAGQVFPTPLISCEPASVMVAATNYGGMSITPNNDPLYTFWLSSAISAANSARPKLQEFSPNEAGRVVLRPFGVATGFLAEVLVLRQPINGNTNMRFNVNIAWDEYLGSATDAAPL